MEVESDAPVHHRRITEESEKRSLVARHAESGKSMARFCRGESTTVWTFRNW